MVWRHNLPDDFFVFVIQLGTDVTHIRKLRLKMYNEMQEESHLNAYWCGGTGIIAVIRLKKHCKIALGNSIMSCPWSVKKQWIILGDRQLNYFTVKGDRYKCIHQSSSNKSDVWMSKRSQIVHCVPSGFVFILFIPCQN